MASTSGTTSFQLEIGDLIEESAARAGMDIRSGFQLQSAIRTLNLLLSDWANRGLSLFAIDDGTLSIVAGTSQYTMPSDTVDLLNMMINLGSTDFYVDRIGVASWAQIAVKSTTGRPIQAWVERLTGGVQINLWPVPDQAYTLKYWRLRRLEDAGSAGNAPDVPFRFAPALVSGLAYYLAIKKSPADVNQVTLLKSIYMDELQTAQAEDRGRESFFIGVYGGPS